MRNLTTTGLGEKSWNVFLLDAAWVRFRAERPSVSYTKVNVNVGIVRSVQNSCLSFAREFDYCVLINIKGRGSGNFGQDCEVCTFALALAKPMEASWKSVTLILVVGKSLVRTRRSLHGVSASLRAWNKCGVVSERSVVWSTAWAALLVGQKNVKNRDNFWKSGLFCDYHFGSCFLTAKMGVNIFYKKKLKEIVENSMFGSRFWLLHLVVRISSFFMFFSFSEIGRAEWVLKLHSLLFMRTRSN